MDKRVRDMMWPFMKKPFMSNNFDNRFKAQEKLMQEQHQMIKGSLDNFTLYLKFFFFNLSIFGIEKENTIYR